MPSILEPKKGAALFAPFLQEQGYEVEVVTTLDVYLDTAKMSALDLIVPIWTMSTITLEQEKGLLEAVKSGVGIAGWHGCMADSFRNNPEYQFMVGGQWIAHPGKIIDSDTALGISSSVKIVPEFPSASVPGAYESDFHFDTARPTAHKAFFLNVLNSANSGTCGNQCFELDVEQDVTTTRGCLSLGLDLVNRDTEYDIVKVEGEKLYYGARPTEYDIVKVEGEKLYYGARPTDGSGLDTPEKRPTALQAPLIRKEDD